MNITKITHILAQMQRLLQVLQGRVDKDLELTLRVDGFNLSAFAAQVIKTKHRLQDVPEGSYASTYIVSAMHLPPATARLLEETTDPVHALGFAVQQTPWGLMLDFKDTDAAEVPPPHLAPAVYGLRPLVYWARQVGARWIVVHRDGPVVDGLPTFDSPVLADADLVGA